MRIAILSSIAALLFNGCVAIDTPLPKINIDNNTSLTYVLEKMNFKKAGNDLYASEQTSVINKISIPPKDTGSYRIKAIKNKYKSSYRPLHNSYFGMSKYDQNLELICKAKNGSMVYDFEDLDGVDIIFGKEFKFDGNLKFDKYSSIVDDKIKYIPFRRHICKKNDSDDTVFLQLDYKIKDKEKYTFIDFSDNTIELIKHREKDFKNYLIKLDAELLRIENMIVQEKQKEQEKELKEKAEKYLEAANKLKKIEQLRERKGQHVMTFLESCSYRAYGYKDLGGRYQHVSEQAAEKMCREICSGYVFNNSGYDNLQEALNDGWKFKAKAKESKEQINEHCVCEGDSYVLEK